MKAYLDAAGSAGALVLGRCYELGEHEQVRRLNLDLPATTAKATSHCLNSGEGCTWQTGAYDGGGG